MIVLLFRKTAVDICWHQLLSHIISGGGDTASHPTISCIFSHCSCVVSQRVSTLAARPATEPGEAGSESAGALALSENVETDELPFVRRETDEVGGEQGLPGQRVQGRLCGTVSLQ